MISSPSSIQTASVGPLALPRRLSFILQLFELWPKQEPPAKPQNDTDDRFHVVTIQGGDTGTTSFCAELEGRSKGRGMKYCPGDTETQDLLAAGTGYYSLIAVSRFYLNKSCSFSYRNDVTLLSSQLVWETTKLCYKTCGRWRYLAKGVNATKEVQWLFLILWGGRKILSKLLFQKLQPCMSHREPTNRQHKAGSLQLCLRKTCQGCFLIAELKDKNTLRGKVFGTQLFLLLFISQCCYDPKIKQSHKQRFLPACVWFQDVSESD